VASSTIATARPFAIPVSLRQGHENVSDLSIRTLGWIKRPWCANLVVRSERDHVVRRAAGDELVDRHIAEIAAERQDLWSKP
jgi:hypothetical protein